MQESGEMYLETIYLLNKESRQIRSVDVADRMQYSKASVSRAVSILKTEGCVSVSEKGFLQLTEKGKRIAETILERHELLAEVLMHLGVSRENAIKDACRIEHVISHESFQAVKDYYISQQSRGGEKSV